MAITIVDTANCYSTQQVKAESKHGLQSKKIFHDCFYYKYVYFGSRELVKLLLILPINTTYSGCTIDSLG